MADEVHEGGCLCGGVRYRVTGPLRDVIVCHCSICRKTHGGPATYSRSATADLEISSDTLRWHEHNESRRGFCGVCGSRLFWQRSAETTSITAGTLDEPTGLHTIRHIFVDSAADWE